jgi:hypothetical protein
MTFCAASWLFQKVSPAICASSSARRWVNLGTSKKPPQVGQLVGGGGDLWFNEVKHARGKYRNRRPEASRIIGATKSRHISFLKPGHHTTRSTLILILILAAFPRRADFFTRIKSDQLG